MGAPRGQSYGRPVAPVQVEGNDLGRQIVRQGDAYAAPDFLGNDPAYRFQLLQDERLARLNGLGVHDFYVQPPAEYRANPGYVPSRETVAQFFDTPTPIAGMRPEAEARYVELLNNSSSVDEITSFVESQGGFKLDRAAVEKWIAERDAARAAGNAAPGYATYTQPPMPLTDTGTGASGAAVRGFGQGFVAGGLDELGAFPDMLGLTAGRENIWNSDRRLADIWANNQQQNASILGYDESAHPIASTTGEVTGAVTSGFAIPWGAGARTVPQLARVGAAYGGAEGFLGTDGGIADRTQGAAIGAPIGAGINAVGGKAIEFAAPIVARAYRAMSERRGSNSADAARQAAQGYGEDQALDAAQGAFQPQRAVDRLDIPPGTPSSAYAPPESPVGTSYPGPAGGRERDWMDIANVPPPPPGFTLDEAVNDNLATARAIGMDAEPMPGVSAPLRQRDYINVGTRPQRLDQPLSEAQMRAITENIRPSEVLPMPSNVIGSPEEAAAINAGRIAPAKAPNERDALTRQTVRNWQGQEVPTVGPVDLVGFLRLNGGLVDQGGELAHMGIVNNAPRRGIGQVGQEARFGPMLNPQGMTLDDAAMRAWEAGYFPEHSERPDINTFLDGLRETYNGGSGRRFRADDYGQLEAFDALQAERFALEQQQLETGQPVYQDRSVPADAPPPFPPVEAYEEWPADAIQRAGNIDLSKLQTPQDINRALYQVNARVGFDAATRGRVTLAETERLAADIGMTADDLLKRRRGQALNAEEALAARQILAKSGNELVNLAKRIKQFERPGDELEAAWTQALMRHAAIQEQVSGMTAEAGRALGQFKMLASSRAVSGEVLASLRDLGGGPKRIKEAAELILDAVEDGPGRFNTVARKVVNPRFRDKLAELYINNLVSGPQTHVVNMVSNTLTALGQIPETAVAAAIGGVRRAVARQPIDRVLAGEVGARAFGLLQGTREGAQFFLRALKTGETSDTFSKIAGHDMRAISGAKGEVVRLPGRFLNAEDEFFKGMSRRAEINALAYRQAHREGLQGDALKARIAELSANPPENIELKALDHARYMTFQQPLNGVPQNLSRAVRDNPELRAILTFVRTPTNLLKFAVERSPGAPLIKEWRKDFAAGGARRDVAMAKAMMGTGFAAVMYQAALKGHITGSAPSDPAKNRYERADGWQPYSFRVGDKWVSYARLDPFSTTIGVAADLATKADGMSDRQLENYSALLVASIIKSMGDKTWLSGISDFTEAVSDWERHGSAYVRRLGASLLIPNAFGQLARSIDPVQRERETFGEELQARIPGASDNLLPSRDIWGRPNTTDRMGPDIISPFQQSAIRNDPVNREMLAINARQGLPSKSYTVEGVKREWTPEQYDKLQEMAGSAAHASLSAVIQTPQYRRMSQAQRLKVVRKVFEDAREGAKGVLLGQPAKVGRRSSEEVPPPPAGYQVEGEAAGVNVYRDLQQAIPGVRFTSGFRTPEYQEDMRRRGYRPAQNSAHLDGSALDMLPPQGKSLGWLRGQVRKQYPNARLSIHDGHLHAEFPGYYGAPPLEGARAAGIRNPSAGIPAPPAGFTLD